MAIVVLVLFYGILSLAKADWKVFSGLQVSPLATIMLLSCRLFIIQLAIWQAKSLLYLISIIYCLSCIFVSQTHNENMYAYVCFS